MSLPRVLTAIITPMCENVVDYESFDDLIKFQLSHKETGIVLFGTTGECPTIEKEEKLEIMKYISDNYYIDNKFVIGVGGNNTKECIELVKLSKQYGFNTFMLTTPYYNKPTQFGLYHHFKNICNEFSNDTFILYNVPGRCAINLLPQTVFDICKSCPNVIAIKEASGDLSQMITVRRICPNLTFYCGDDGLVVPAMSIGAYGVISVLSNYNPRVVIDIIEMCLENKYQEAFTLYSQVDEIIKLLFSETSPSPIKFLLKEIKLIETDNVRLPLVSMQNSDNKHKLINLVDKLNTYYLLEDSKAK
jgi:4-hydroxy-tetrahydrodipicolinate synthase